MLLPPPFCQQTRQARLDAAPGTVYDLVVIGGGITGTGIARDAAMRGLRVALLEKDDVASGTSSRSSKLVHGGLRYLEHYEFGLVFESVSERALLRRLAPHLVRPIPFLFPGFRGDRVPLAMMAAGVTLYDLLSLGRAYRFHRRFSRAATRRLESSLRDEGLRGSLLYYDCATDDARLTLATAISAHDHGAHVLTRVRVDALLRRRGSVEGVEATDVISGRPLVVHAHAVVCALGPWSDRFLDRHSAGHTRMLRPTKGVHIVLPRERLPVRHAVVISGPGDHRILFAIPWGTHTYVGTTDTDDAGDPDRVAADAEDIDYLMQVLQRDFPGQQITPDDIVSTWAGLRPLIDERGAEDASSVSREHRIDVHDDGLIAVAGGKLTTYRRMAAEVLEAARARLRLKGVQMEQCRTHKHPLMGGGVPPRASRDLERALGPDACADLQRRYGSDWDAVAQLAASGERLAEVVVPGLPYRVADLVHAMREECALTLDDLLCRRTEIFLKAPDQGLECLDRVAELAAAELGWDARRRALEMDRYRALVARSREFRG